MKRREIGHVAGLLALSVVLRALLFHKVGVWGDAGFYIYDARLILDGQVPYVDFVGRSPLFNYGYAAYASVVGNSMVTLREFIVSFWILAGVPVYLVGRRVRGHAAGLASLAVFALSPFMLVYGYWANTQSLAALLAITAVCVVLYREGWPGYALAGAALGTGFLARRSVIVVLGAVGLYAVSLGVRDRQAAPMVARGTAAVAGFLAPLAVGYYALAGGDLSLAAKFAEVHGWGLISSSGRGGFPLITDKAPPPVTRSVGEHRIPIFHDLCQLCSPWTLRVFVKTTLASVVAVGPLLYYADDWFQRLVPPQLRWYAGSGALAIGAYASFKALQAGFTLRVGAVVGLAAFGYLVAETELPPASVLYGRRVALPLLCCLALAGGYLYRNRIIHTYYFADLMPFVSVVAGGLYVHLYREVWADG